METLLILSKKTIFVAEMMGVVLLSSVLTIEYYNQIVFNSEHLVLFSDLVDEEIYYFLRTAIWKFHFYAGILLFLVMLFIGENGKSKLNNYLVYSVSIVGVSGGVNYLLNSENIHIFHVMCSIIASFLFVLIVLRRPMEELRSE